MQWLRVVTPPTEEPIELDEIRSALRVPTKDDDSLIGELALAAREALEQRGVAPLTQTVDQILSAWPAPGIIRPALYPVQSVTSIKYIDRDAVEQTVPTADYVLSPTEYPTIGLVDGASWPTDLRAYRPITIRLVVGYADPSLIPRPLRAALLYHIRALYDLAPEGDWRSSYEALIAPYLPVELGA